MTHLTHYQEITLLPDSDIGPYFIWGKVFTQLHIALADIKNKQGVQSIGVSFPDYHYDKSGKTSKLGNKLRVFATTQDDLVKLDLEKWLGRLMDYVHIKSIKEVPADIKGYVTVQRYRFRPKDLQAQSLSRKLGISLSDAISTVEKREPEKQLPFIQLSSITNKTPFQLKVLQQSAEESSKGDFNSYGMNGMSGSTTVPAW